MIRSQSGIRIEGGLDAVEEEGFSILGHLERKDEGETIADVLSPMASVIYYYVMTRFSKASLSSSKVSCDPTYL